MKEVKAINNQNESSNWTVQLNENNEKVYYLNLSEDEIQAAAIDKLKTKYEGEISLINDQYSYTYTPLSSYTTGSNATDYILTGTYLSWAQRSSVSFTSTVSFTLSTSYQSISGSSSMSMGINDTISFNSTYDSKLGLFCRLRLTKYRITVTDNYTGGQVSSYIDYDITVLAKTYRPVYAYSTGTLFYVYGTSNYNAKMIKNNLTTPSLTSSDYVTASRSYF